ncbi:MAG: hypothetical protein AAF628_25960 [Planctomycetota bacterium]
MERQQRQRRRGAARTVAAAVMTALKHPRVWLTVWLVVLLPSLLAVLPAVASLDRALAPHPGASMVVEQALDVDFVRQHPEVQVPWFGAAVFVALVLLLFGGGVLAHVGRGTPHSYGTLWADGGRLLLRNLRALLIGGVLAWLLTWGCGAFESWVLNDWLPEADPGAMLFGIRLLSLEVGIEAMRYVFGLAFLGLLLLTKMAMARMALFEGRSASLAWLRVVLWMLRHPLRVGLVVASFALLWLVVGYVTGEITVRALESSSMIWLGLAAGQLGMMALAILVVASLVAAREMLPQPAPERSDPLAEEGA